MPVGLQRALTGQEHLAQHLGVKNITENHNKSFIKVVYLTHLHLQVIYLYKKLTTKQHFIEHHTVNE